MQEIPSLGSLFQGFFWVGVNGFGGVMPWARRMVVEQKRWLSEEEFIDQLSMCQFIPGPNIVNFCVALGGRFHGPMGSLACVAGILLAPMAIAITAFTLLAQVADNPVVIGAIHGMSAAAAGLVVTLAVKVGTPLAKRRDLWGMAMAAAAVASVALLHLPLIATLAVLAPLAVAGERVRRR